MARYSGVGPETPDTFRGASGLASGRHHMVHTSWRDGDSSQRDRRLRCRAETPRPGGVLSMTLQKPGDSGHRGRILRPPEDSGPPPVVFRTDTREAPHMWRRAGKSRGPETPACHPGNSGQEFSGSKKTLPLLHFLVNDARDKICQLTCST